MTRRRWWCFYFFLPLLRMELALSATQVGANGPLIVADLVTLPAMMEGGNCRCCAQLRSHNSSLNIAEAAQTFCHRFDDAKPCSVATAIVNNGTCVPLIERLLLQRLRLFRTAVLLPVVMNRQDIYFFSSSEESVEQDARAFCSYFHVHGHESCVESLKARAAQEGARATAARAFRSAPEPAEDASRVYVWPVEHSDGFYREQQLLKEGIAESRELVQVYRIDEADYVWYLLTGPITPASPVHHPDVIHPSKLVVLDFSDEPVMPTELQSPDLYLAYFKRSWVRKEGGKIVDPATPSPFAKDAANVSPLPYAALAEYWGPQVPYMYRDHSVTCTLRPTVPVRTRVLQWVMETVADLDLEDAFVGQITDAVRHGVDATYRDLLGRSRIIVTVNPDGWDGDMRTWEALASGALVVIDAMHTPLPHGTELTHGEHVVVYDNGNRTDLVTKLLYYLQHVDEAQEIARRGQAMTMRHHRAMHRVEYVSRLAQGHTQRRTTRGADDDEDQHLVAAARRQ